MLLPLVNVAEFKNIKKRIRIDPYVQRNVIFMESYMKCQF